MFDKPKRFLADGFKAKAEVYYASARVVDDIPKDTLTCNLANVHKALGDLFTAVAKELVKNDN